MRRINDFDFEQWFEKKFGKRPEGSLYTLNLELEQAQRRVNTLKTGIAAIEDWEAKWAAALHTAHLYEQNQQD